MPRHPSILPRSAPSSPLPALYFPCHWTPSPVTPPPHGSARGAVKAPAPSLGLLPELSNKQASFLPKRPGRIQGQHPELPCPTCGALRTSHLPTPWPLLSPASPGRGARSGCRPGLGPRRPPGPRGACAAGRGPGASLGSESAGTAGESRPRTRAGSGRRPAEKKPRKVRETCEPGPRDGPPCVPHPPHRAVAGV